MWDATFPILEVILKRREFQQLLSPITATDTRETWVSRTRTLVPFGSCRCRGRPRSGKSRWHQWALSANLGVSGWRLLKLTFFHQNNQKRKAHSRSWTGKSTYMYICICVYVCACACMWVSACACVRVCLHIGFLEDSDHKICLKFSRINSWLVVRGLYLRYMLVPFMILK